MVSVIGSCDYDDSNDIDYIIPNDSTSTSNIQKSNVNNSEVSLYLP